METPTATGRTLRTLRTDRHRPPPTATDRQPPTATENNEFYRDG